MRCGHAQSIIRSRPCPRDCSSRLVVSRRRRVSCALWYAVLRHSRRARSYAHIEPYVNQAASPWRPVLNTSKQLTRNVDHGSGAMDSTCLLADATDDAQHAVITQKDHRPMKGSSQSPEVHLARRQSSFRTVHDSSTVLPSVSEVIASVGLGL